MFRRLGRGTLAILFLLTALATNVSAQASGGSAPTGSISGRVIDAESGRPIAEAVIALEPEPGGVLPSASGGSFLTMGRSLLSDSAGRYHFSGLPAGRYRLHISHLGYRAAVITVELHGAADSRVSVGLSVQPVALEPVEVHAPVREPFGRDQEMAEEVRGARRSAMRDRQRVTLTTDARELTHADVIESITLGETDIFRALQRTPGVNARDDYNADLLVRGASWDQTRIYFDGLPLFNPLHAFGLFSAVNPDAVGGALLYPGVRPASIGDASAAVVDVTSRRGGGTGEVRVLGDLSLASAKLALDQSFHDGRGAWMIAGRRSWFDLLASAVARLSDDPSMNVPYAFSDLTGRFDYQLDGERSITTSTLVESDRVSGDIPDVVQKTLAHWGNQAARVTYSAPLGQLRARYTLGLSRYGARTRSAVLDSAIEAEYNASEGQPADNDVLRLSLQGELSPRTTSGEPLPWRAGYALVHEQSAYDGPLTLAYGDMALTSVEPIHLHSRLSYAALWGERRWSPQEKLTLEAGLRAEAGPRVENGGVLRLSPRLTARYALSSNVALSAGVGRSYQYDQALGPSGVAVVPGMWSSHIWSLADGTMPAIRSDIATLGAEGWRGGDWLLSANAYLRHSTGILTPDPTPGLLDGREYTVVGSNHARGVELSARRLAGRWTASFAYSYGVSTLDAVGLHYPAPGDHRHTFDATSMLRVGEGLRLGAAFTAASGAPYTRISNPSWSCGSSCPVELLAPNAERAPAYQSLDLLLDWTHHFRHWDFGAYLQLRNALGHDNSVSYHYTYEQCADGGYTSNCPAGYVLVDDFVPGLPTVPVFGFRVRF